MSNEITPAQAERRSPEIDVVEDKDVSAGDLRRLVRFFAPSAAPYRTAFITGRGPADSLAIRTQPWEVR